MDYQKITIQDCINFSKEGTYAILNDGKIIGFIEE